MDSYYELTAALRAKLEAAGEEWAAADLLSAERGAATSGEIISNMSVVLRSLRESGVLSRADATDEAAEIERIGRQAWNASNGR